MRGVVLINLLVERTASDTGAAALPIQILAGVADGYAYSA